VERDSGDSIPVRQQCVCWSESELTVLLVYWKMIQLRNWITAHLFLSRINIKINQ
jgi:hypothetical protein